MKKINLPLLFAILLSACSSQPTATSTTTITPTLTPQISATPSFSLTLTPSPTPTLVPVGDFMKGFTYGAGWTNDYSSPTGDWVLGNLVKPMGVDWIKISMPCQQATDTTTSMDCTAVNVPTDDDLIHVIKRAHNLGLRVLFEPGIWVLDNSNGAWAGTIGRGWGEDEWSAWFANYEKMIIHFAEISEDNHVDYFTVGAEMPSTTVREKEWRALIAKVREVYHGPITYGAYQESDWLNIKWWDAVDAIGLHPYDLNLSDSTHPTVEQITVAWKPIVDRIEALSKKFDRPVIITEIGYPSYDGVSFGTYDLGYSTWTLDLDESAVMHQALVNAFGGKPWFKGLFWFVIMAVGDDSQPTTFRFNTYKPESDVIRSFYGAPPPPTMTPVPPLPSEFSHELTIYDNYLNRSWSNYPPNGDPNNIDFSQSKIAMERNAIKVTVGGTGELIFGTPPGFDFKPYQWLEFYIYIPQDTKILPVLNVSLKDDHFRDMPYFVNITDSKYIQDGHLEKGKWQRVDIPLDAIGPILVPISSIVINRNALFPNDVILYMDNVRLLGN